MNTLSSQAGQKLYQLLPAVYRSRDQGDLAALLDSLGDLLDRFRNTLDQRLADCFPDLPREGLACQDWLLPYFAELVDARLVSPDPEGQRAEVANTIAWRQTKGTLACVERVAQDVGRLEIEVQEGWKRVAMTQRIGLSRPTDSGALGLSDQPGRSGPFAAARPPGTVDFRVHSRALQTDPADPVGRSTRFGGQLLRWRQAYAAGAPCFPGSFEDVSARTVDLRRPDGLRGHAHPRRLLLYHPPPEGFFPAGATPAGGVAWSDWLAAGAELTLRIGQLDAAHVDLLVYQDAQKQSVTVERLRPPAPDTFPVVVRMRRGTDVFADRTTAADGTVTTRARLSGRWLTGVAAADGSLLVRGDGSPLVVTGDPALSGAPVFVFEDLALTGSLTVPPAARLRLRRVAVAAVEAAGNDLKEPVVDAVDSLLGGVSAKSGLVRLEYVTVLEKTSAARLQASDCLFVDFVGLGLPNPGWPSCVRYSRVPPDFAAFPPSSPFHDTADQPLWVELDFATGSGSVRRAAVFGEPGCAVLHSGAPASIRFGAEDGGEMGAYHHLRYALAEVAVATKLSDFLPVGLSAVLIADPRLLSPPPSLPQP